MKSFKNYIYEKKVRKGSPDPTEAKSLISQAEQRLIDLLELPLSDSNASFRFESAYETLREALQSFLALKGYKPYSHEVIFVYSKEKGILSLEEYMKGNRFREIRNDINYRGKKVLKEEAEEIISFVKVIMEKLKGLFNQMNDH